MCFLIHPLAPTEITLPVTQVGPRGPGIDACILEDAFALLIIVAGHLQLCPAITRETDFTPQQALHLGDLLLLFERSGFPLAPLRERIFIPPLGVLILALVAGTFS